MKHKNLYIYLLFLAIHIFIAMVAFLHFRLDPFHQAFSNGGDGLKNNFNLISYVKSPITADGIFKFNSFSYPFGDYVYYTDNTPLFAIPFRWLCQHVYDLSAYTLIIFNIFVISNIFISGILLYKILRQLLNEQLFSFIMAVILPWANMQVMRVWFGHYSLSFSALILTGIWLLMLWHKYRYAWQKQVAVAVAMVLLSVASFLAHGYYLAIITLFGTAMLFAYGVFTRKERYGRFTILVSFIYPLLAVGTTMLLLASTDKYLSLRKAAANGYDSLNGKVRFFSLYGHYNFQKIFFPFYYDIDTTDPDRAGYMGNIGLYTVLIILFGAMINRRFRTGMVKIQKDFFRDPLKAAILIGALIMLFVSLGEVYSASDARHEPGYHFVNLLNPLFYVHFFTNRVEQFRCLERFVWPFFFGFNIWVAYTIVTIYRQSELKIKIGIVAAVLFLGGGELYDFADALQHRTDSGNYLSESSVKKATPGHLNPMNYQAILPIPFYCVGSEDYDYTIDDNDWSTYTFRLQLNTGLPLMSCKMSRTPPLYSKILTEFVAYDSLNVELKEKLNHKPILVAVCRRMLTDVNSGNRPNNDNAVKLFINSMQFVERHHLVPVDSTGDGIFFYNYYPEL